jgi:1,4-dihydroxy-2-naphthoate octaprenyltransferase
MIESKPPQGLLATTRAQVLPVILLPVGIGATYAWAVANTFSWIWLGATLLGAACLHLAANVINDVFDIQSGADEVADEMEDSIRTGSPNATPGLAVGLLLIGSGVGVVLALYRGPLVLIYGLIGAALAVFYVAPPISIGYRGRGLGEIAITIAFGPLPVAGAYYVQIAPTPVESYTGPLSGSLLGVPLFVWAVGLFPGLLTMLVLYHHHFLHHSADRAVGKMTPVAAWGPDAAIKISRPLIILTALVLIGLVVLRIVPWWSIVAVLPLTLAWSGVARAATRRDLSGYLLVLRASAATSIAAQSILIISLLLPF